ncbi:MAG: hypothetical protein FD146_2041 [Anaerolineaceae bacterium]|nr:MAG: hypothetical protein FD146_2041 [Anaerolineaceae bacterium]
MNNRNDRPAPEDRLADFTDRLMAGEIPQEAATREADGELFQLQETARRVREAFPPRKPDTAMQNRIRANLTAELRRSRPSVRPASSWTLRLALAIGTVAILALILVFLPSGPLTTPGAAGNTSIWIPIAIFLTVIAGFAFWRLRKK